MKRCWFVSGLVFLVILIMGTGIALSQSTGFVLQWGSHVIVGPEVLEDFVTVAGGGYHSLGLKSDGTIVAWGSNAYNSCDVPVPNADFMTVAAGGQHSLGLKSDGTIGTAHR